MTNESDKTKPVKKKVLLTSVCRPMGAKYGDATSVGYELLYRQVLRAQGIFSPRTVNIQYSLEYIAENLDTPTVVLQYPSKRELIRDTVPVTARIAALPSESS